VAVKNAVFWDVTLSAVVRTDVSEELIAFFIKVTRIGELGTKLAITRNGIKLRRNTGSISSQRALIVIYR
jgi:hypothetical protein